MTTPAAAANAARRIGGPVAVKALVAAGRRGKANAVRLVESADAAAAAAEALIGRSIDGLRVDRVYVERRATIARELYLSFAFGTAKPQIVLSSRGGIEIEETFRDDLTSVVRNEIDLRKGLQPWDAMDLWERAGIEDNRQPCSTPSSPTRTRAVYSLATTICRWRLATTFLRPSSRHQEARH